MILFFSDTEGADRYLKINHYQPPHPHTLKICYPLDFNLSRCAIRLPGLPSPDGDGCRIGIGARGVRHVVEEGNLRECASLIYGVSGCEDVPVVSVEVQDLGIVIRTEGFCCYERGVVLDIPNRLAGACDASSLNSR